MSLGFTKDGQSLYLMSSIGRDTAAVVEKNLADGKEKGARGQRRG